MKHLLTSILFLSIFLIISCGDNYTCDDCIYFTCDVDGEEFRPDCSSESIFGCSAIDAKYFIHGSRDIYVYIKNEERDDNIRINSINITDENEYYPLIKANNKNFISTFYRGSAECNKYRVDTMSTSDRLYITEIDTINWIIAGEFNFTGFNECTGDPVHITNGKFRLNYTF